MKSEIKLKAIVDRIEGSKVVLLLGEDEQNAVDFPKNFLPDGVQESDILNLKIEIKSRKTKQAKEQVAQMIAKLASRPLGRKTT